MKPFYSKKLKALRKNKALIRRLPRPLAVLVLPTVAFQLPAASFWSFRCQKNPRKTKFQKRNCVTDSRYTWIGKKKAHIENEATCGFGRMCSVGVLVCHATMWRTWHYTRNLFQMAAMIFTYAPRTFDISTSPSWTSTTTKANAETKEKTKKGVGKRDFSTKTFSGRLSQLSARITTRGERSLSLLCSLIQTARVKVSG